MLNDQLCQKIGQWLVQRARADALNPVCLAITNPDGALHYFLRMDGTPIRTIAIAQAKAYSAARLGTTTLAFQQRLHNESLSLLDFMDPLLCSLPGGSPILIDNQLIGAIGISGRPLNEDHALSNATATQTALFLNS